MATHDSVAMALEIEQKGRQPMAVRKFRITVNGVVYEVEAEEIPSVGQMEPPKVSQPAAVQETPVPPKTVARAQTASKDTAVIVEAPLPGAVLDVRAQVGQVVEMGQIIVILEAMKMENEITAPIAGRISAIQVQKGGAVNAQDPLFTIEP